MGTVKHSHTIQPGQPPHYQICSSCIITEEACTQLVQLPHTYTTVVYQCYTLRLVVVQKTTQNTTLGSHHATRAVAFTVTQTVNVVALRVGLYHS